jgi:polyisoprenoid-binding protein YceI
MKKMLLSLVIVFLTFSMYAGNVNPIEINLEKSTVTWEGKKVTGAHSGTIAIQSAKLTSGDDGVLAGGSFTIDMTSLKVTDLEGEWKEKLEGHLFSEDFFNVAKFPEAMFQITSVSSRGKAGEYKISGDLTIKGITKPVKFNATTEGGMMKAHIQVDRTEYDIRYGSGSFFDNLGDKTIYDEFDIHVALAIAG